jgi:hypothetical protein
MAVQKFERAIEMQELIDQTINWSANLGGTDLFGNRPKRQIISKRF